MTDEPKKKKGWNKGNTLHGMSQSATYQTWRRLKLSCGPTAKRPCKKWPRTMDGRWMADFIFFLKDMGEQPDGTVLRIRKGSPNGRMHYGPAECEWRPKDEPHYKRVMFDPAAIAHAATIRRSKALAAERSEPAAAEQQAQRATREPTFETPSQTIQTDDKPYQALEAADHQPSAAIAALLDMDYGDDD